MTPIREGTTPISEEKGSGHPRSLDDKYVAVIIRWFLQCEDDGRKTTQRDFIFAAFNTFGVWLSQPTLSRLVIVACCRTHKLCENEIYVEIKGDSKYYAEDAYAVDHVMGQTKPWARHIFLSDKGNAFRPGGESIILDNGAEGHYIFDPPINGKMNPCDAHLHPYAKAQWVSMRKDDDPRMETNTGSCMVRQHSAS